MPRKLELDVHKVVCATIDLIEEIGLEQVSMRKIGEIFGIQAASLYWYVESRDALLDLAADEIYHRMATLIGTLHTSDAHKVKQYVITMRGYLLGHHGNPEVLATRTVGGPGYCLLLEHLIGALRDQGATKTKAVRGALALSAYTLGSVLMQTAPLAVSLPTSADFRQLLAEQAEAPLVAASAELIAYPDHTDRFTSGLTAMLTGFGLT